MKASDKESSSRKLTRKKSGPKHLSKGAEEQERDSALTTDDGASSDDAALFLLAKEAVHSAETPAEREARKRKIEQLKKALAEGSYSADARAVAERVLEEHLDNDFGKNRL